MNSKRLILVSLFAALTLVSGWLAIPIGAVPITMQTLLVVLTAMALKPGEAFAAMSVHLILKLFTTAGATVTTPSLGFVIGFIFAAWIGSIYFLNLGAKASAPSLILGIFITMLIPYVIGLPVMAFILQNVMGLNNTVSSILQMGLIPFIPGDLLKVVLAYLIGERLRLRQLAFQ